MAVVSLPLISAAVVILIAAIGVIAYAYHRSHE